METQRAHFPCDLCDVFGTPSIALFASRLNKQVVSFCSWKPDPEAEYFDSFSLNWAQFELSHLSPILFNC